jgi:hypothetical protein
MEALQGWIKEEGSLHFVMPQQRKKESTFYHSYSIYSCPISPSKNAISKNYEKLREKTKTKMRYDKLYDPPFQE